MLQDMLDKANTWFENMLKDAELEPESEVDQEMLAIDENVPVEQLAILDGVPDLMDFDSVLPFFVQPQGLSRQLVDMGEGTEELKVYFDHFSGGAGGHSTVQRGFVYCVLHGCIKYRPVVNESLAEFCGWFLAWTIHRAESASKPDHLNFVPSATQIAHVREHMRMKPF